MADFKVAFASGATSMRVQFESDVEGRASFGEVQTVSVGGEVYKGDYAVTPKVEGQTLPTRGKLLTKDVTINSIPVFRVSNTSGGTTVYIASEV